MIVEHDVPLAPLTTLGLGGPAQRFVRVIDDRDLTEVLTSGERMLVLGGGSNLVVADAGFPGLVVRIASEGFTVERAGERALVTARAGTPWDAFVAEMVGAGFAGVECLSGIPGLVGATPMQNVGAYGQEVSDTITDVRAFDREVGGDVSVANAGCAFGYRTSKFRGSTRWTVRDVRFALARSELSAPIRYGELAKALGIREGERAPLQRVRDTVIALRRGKGMVIDAADPESRSAGSFFTNPVVELANAARVPTEAPRWAQPDGRVKLSAAWLIEHAGFAKGYASDGVGISNKHALALVHRGGGTTRALLALATAIQTTVRDRFGIALEIEPVIV
jgi:UDP-N-acetylmuramate dehydrogenase